MKKLNLFKNFALGFLIFAVTGTLAACATTGNTPNTTNPTTNSTTNPTTGTNLNSTEGSDTSYNRGTTTNNYSSRNLGNTTTTNNYNNNTDTYNRTGIPNNSTSINGLTNSSYLKGTLSKYTNMANNIPTYSPGAEVNIDFMFNNYNSSVNNATANTTKNMTNTTGNYEKLKVYVYKDTVGNSNLVDTHNVKDFKSSKIAADKDLSYKCTFKAPTSAGSYVYKAVVVRDGVDEIFYDHFNVK